MMFLKNAAFTFCLLVLMVFNSKLCAQIIYTDIPDATPNASYYLDLNNDDIVDFLIYFGESAGKVGVMCSPFNNNAYAGENLAGVHLAMALAASNNICDTLLTWYDSSKPGTMALGNSMGNWLGATDKYLALKLIVGTNTYFGWARLDVLNTSSSFTIKDYAYESKPNVCIQTGQSITGINENTHKNIFSIYPNPFISSTTINTIDHFNNASLTIFNTFGQPLKEVKNISGQSLTISRDNLPSGLYYLRLAEENKYIAVEKLIITD